MGIAQLDDELVLGVVSHYAKAVKSAILTGAGASVEAGLPSWPVLAERLLYLVSEKESLFSAEANGGASPEVVRRWREDWIRATLMTESPVGAIAVAEALSSAGVTEHLHDALYGPEPAQFSPGPIARALADLKAESGTSLHLYTMNYDDLSEVALRQNAKVQAEGLSVVSYVGDDDFDGEHLKVRHMHGLCGVDGETGGRFVVTDRDYAEVDDDRAYPYDEFASDLRRHGCLIVGASLNDPNVNRLLWRQQRLQSRARKNQIPPLHVIFVRQADAYEQPSEVRAARERAVTERWRTVSVQALFVDHFADVARVINEIRFCRRVGEKAYRPLGARMAETITRIEREIVRQGEETPFRTAQKDLTALLDRALVAAREAAPALGRDGVLVLGLWLFDTEGDVLRLWASSDALQRSPKTVHTADLEHQSQMVVVQAVTSGVGIAEARERPESRWGFMRAFPLDLDLERFGRIPVGAVSLASPREGGELASLGRRDGQLLDAAVARAVSAELVDALEG